MMRRFELKEGGSSKFWEAEVDGATLTVRFGRIGTAGQTKSKPFSNGVLALKEYDKLAKEKSNKGYAEVALTAGATLSAGQAKSSAPTAEKPSAGPELCPVVPSAVTTEPAMISAIQWPSGGFQWDDALRAETPIVRGVHVPAAPAAFDASKWQPLVLEPDDGRGINARALTPLASTMQRSWSIWGQARCAELTTLDQLCQRDKGYWLELCAQTLTNAPAPSIALTRATQIERHERYRHRPALVAATHAGVALHGLPFMLDIAFELAEAVRGGDQQWLLRLNLLIPLRHAIALSDDVTHDQALAATQALVGRNEYRRLLACDLFPHRQDWVLAFIEEGLEDKYRVLQLCAMPAELAQKRLHDWLVYGHHIRDPVLLQVALHGEGALDLLAQLLLRAADKLALENAIGLLLRMHTPRTLRLLADSCEHKEARDALEQLAERWPAAVMLCVLERAFAKRSRLLEGWLSRMAVRWPEAVPPLRDSLGAANRNRLDTLLRLLDVEEAPAHALPPLLREPPWLRKTVAIAIPGLTISAPEMAERITLPTDTKARDVVVDNRHWVFNGFYIGFDRTTFLLKKLMISPEGQARLAAHQALLEQDVFPTQDHYGGGTPEILWALPAPVALAVWNSYPTKYWRWFDSLSWPARTMLARHGAAAIDGLLRLAQHKAELGLTLALVVGVDSPRLVPIALHALRSLKKTKRVAMDWLRTCVPTAAVVALSQAFGKEGATREDARFGLRWLVANGFEAQVRDVAASLSDELPAALQALLDADPLFVLPARMPKLPAFFVPASMRRPELRSGGVLSSDATCHAGSMLAISPLDNPYAGIEVLRQVCTPESLAEFAWDLFEAWTTAGYPSKDGWAFAALGLLGNDETARRLALKIREWPGQGGHQRAVGGLDLLAAIGSDAALMHLNGIASKVKFKTLQERAREKIAAIAQARDLTPMELADRLVPDLGLDESGTLKLDFGPRAFFVGFDETLKPFVKDAQGSRLKDLPKPLGSDDAALAELASTQYKQLKKDAKAIASLQVIRLEMAMVDRRRWRLADFRMFFVEHPLMRHLVTRLLWGVYEGDTLRRTVRVAEDFSFADEHDVLVTLAEDVWLGIAHVLEMSEDVRARFGQVLLDYKVLQPFRQLHRETYALTSAEAGSNQIQRFKDKTVATGSVLGLVNRGWERGPAEDGGAVCGFSKRLSNGFEVELSIDPGTFVGDPSYEPKQKLPWLGLGRRQGFAEAGEVNFGRLHPVQVSELLRDVDLLAAVSGT
jgi:predicted DNA-binding WGR domain protein